MNFEILQQTLQQKHLENNMNVDGYLELQIKFNFTEHLQWSLKKIYIKFKANFYKM